MLFTLKSNNVFDQPVTGIFKLSMNELEPFNTHQTLSVIFYHTCTSIIHRWILLINRSVIDYWPNRHRSLSAEINLPRTWPSEFGIPVESRPMYVRPILKRCIIDGWTMRVIDWYIGKLPVPFVRSTRGPQPLYEDHECPAGSQYKMAKKNPPHFKYMS